ncbi:RNA polymerase sigma factor SigJ [Dactylosporangium sp. NPDC049742]|uniref:RNA polymerase sigma factor SigJ n=1 Tax=Dactylosporangium sp. NPDC049742 TaxID=3154737 RepID=UPI0034298C07
MEPVMAERRRLTDLAYRLLGSLADAEDVVQETYARWYTLSEHQQESIQNPAAWLTTVAGRICLDLLGSARVRRERYVGEWIPEPLPGRPQWIGGRPDGAAPDPAERVTLDESVSMAFLVVLEAMTPAERVAFVLHDVFQYPFAEVAGIVGRSPAACRQLASSARRRIREHREAAPPAGDRTGVVRAFRRAWEAADVDALIDLLDPAVTATGDGGGLVNAAPHPVVGAEEVGRFFAVRTGFRLAERTVNGEPGLVAEVDGAVVAVLAFDVAGDRIRRIWAVLNPEKLRHWTTRTP